MFRLQHKCKCKVLIRYFHKAADYFPRYLQKELPEAKCTKLKNALRVASENWGSPTCTVGLWMDIGSRYETDQNNGVAHFLEHMYFKGTSSRDHKTIESETIERGAKLNTYTTREMIAIYANCHKDDLEWAVGLLSEIVSSPKYDDSVVEKTREIVLKEMENVENNYQEVVFDYLHATAYQGTPLGRSILGLEDVITKMTSKDLHDFVNNFYKAPRMVLAATGDIDHDNLHRMAEKYMGEITCNYTHGIPQRLPCRYTGSDIRDRDDLLTLGHVAMAFQGPGWTSPDYIPLLVASAIYGSYDKTYGGTEYSVNNTAVASYRNGDIHSFQNFFMPYHDTSLWGFYYTSTGKEMQLISEYIIQRMVRLCANVSDFEVNRAKNQLKTNLLLSLNGSTAACDELGRHINIYDRRISLHEIFARINAVDGNVIREVCQKYIYDRCPAVAGYGPIEGLPDYNNIRSRTYWMRY